MSTRPTKPGPRQILDLVDEDDRVVGSVPRSDVFRQNANFRVAHLFLFNDRSELLIQQLASSRSRHPERWGSSVAAYVSSGESYREAITRRTHQELNVCLDCVTLVGKTTMQDQGCEKFIALFSSTWSGPIAIDRSHISRVRFRPVGDVLRLSETEPWKFTPTFVHLMGVYHDRLARRGANATRID